MAALQVNYNCYVLAEQALLQRCRDVSPACHWLISLNKLPVVNTIHHLMTLKVRVPDEDGNFHRVEEKADCSQDILDTDNRQYSYIESGIAVEAER